jgi:hypothetical protein
MWRSKPPEPVLDRETVDGIIRKLMEIDTKLDTILDAPEGDDGEAEEDDA